MGRERMYALLQNAHLIKKKLSKEVLATGKIIGQSTCPKNGANRKNRGKILYL